ncbi:hypothetical protein F4806DRAFT_331749 [Annulohypoxylon nitens]|nr:hypothetical protein F4806DRAFT_331749 [Annulohypoxylon nitens]
MRTQTLAFLIAPVALAATPRARSGLPKSLAQTSLLNSFATCKTGYVTCENACMPADGVCCNDNTDEYCREGYYCIPDACCPDGEICSGSSDGDTADCDIGETECGDTCMPIDGTCCSDGLHYCPDFGTCTDDGYCCDLGDDCSGSSFTSTTGFTSTTSRTTTKTRTTTSTVDTTSTTSSSQTTSTSSTSSSTSTSTSTSSSTTEDSSNNAPITSAPAVTTSVSQQAGGVFTADGRVAAGLAVVAAFLV